VRRISMQLASLAVVCLVCASACGTRIPHSQVIQAAEGPGGSVQGGQSSGSSVGSGTNLSQTGIQSSGGSNAAPVAGGSAGAQTAVGAGNGSSTKGPMATGQSGGAAGGGTSGASGDHTPVVLGQVGTFSGVVGLAQGAGQPAMQVWAQWVNAHGGLAGHPVQLYSYDDNGSPSQAQSDVQQLVQSKHAVALVGAFLPLTISAIESFVDSNKVPVVGGDVVTPDWNQHPYLFPEGASASSLTFGTAQAMKARGQQKVAIWYCQESTACAYADNQFVAAAAKFGLTIVDQEKISLAQPDFTEQCLSANQKGAQAIFVGADGATVGRVARNCVQQSYHPGYYTSALAVTNDQASDPNLNGLTVTSAVFPWMEDSTPAEQQYQNAMRQYAPNLTPSGAAAEAWTSGMTLVAAVDALGPLATQGPLTSSLVAEGLWKLNHATLGGLSPGVTFLSGHPAPQQTCTGLAEIQNGRWTAPQGNTFTCY
jgi:branched-chain amino acid transport system substrate-binding protein